MKAKLLAVMVATTDLWESLATDYRVHDLESYIERARELAPDVFLETPKIVDVVGNIKDENDKYIITWSDEIEEKERIYQKL